MKRIITLLFGAFLLVAIVGSPAQAQIDVFQECTAQTQDTAICKARKDRLFGPGSIWNNILNVFTFIIGAISVLMIIVGGLRYTLSGGDANSVSAAKSTVLYAVIGLVVAVMGNAIVNFVLTNI